MKAYGRRSLVMLVVALVFTLLAGACSKKEASATRYQCPMHPTYISDKPGDCPICGMRLVPVDDTKMAPEPNAPAAPHQHDAPTSSPVSSTPPSGGERRPLYYRSPMDPKVTSPTPAKDSMGMDFVPVYSDEVGSAASVAGYASFDIDEAGMRLAGVRTAVAERARIERTIRAAGVVRPDETRIRQVHTKAAGWIEKLFVDFTGQPVRKGQPILSIYSQELLASQHEYVRAHEAMKKLENATLPMVREGAEEMLAAARRKLELLDMPARSIAELDRTGAPQRAVTLLATASGIVTSKQVFEGMRVEPGMELFVVSDLSRVWIEADVYQNEASAVHVGQRAAVVLPSDPGKRMTGNVKYIYPYLNPETRTIKVRFDFPNPDLQLKLDMYLDVELPVQSDEGIVVPDSAVMDTGVRQIAFVMPRQGHFEPREVAVGIRADGKAQILKGVDAGERVAIKANFLLDSESRLRAAIGGSGATAPAASGAAP